MFTRKNVVISSREPRPSVQRRPVQPAASASGSASSSGSRASGESSTTAPTNLPSNHPGIRPSLVNSLPCVSSGSKTFDTLMQHGGLRIGSLTLMEEHATTDFASSLLKSYAAQGVYEQRKGAKSVVVCVGIPDYLKTLPAVLDQAPKRPKIETAQDRMVIAWRYQALQKAQTTEETDTNTLVAFSRDLNFRANLVPAAHVGKECVYVLGSRLAQILQSLEDTLSKIPPGTLTRVVVPNLLHPVIYGVENSSPAVLVPFIQKLRLVSRKYNATTIVTLPLLLYPRTLPVVATVERLVDNCVELQPLMDTAAAQDIQGLLHVHKLAELSERGLMVERLQEFSFRLSKNQFEIAPFGIPVDMEEQETSESKVSIDY